MKKFVFSLILMNSSLAHAGVTLFGSLDESFRYTSNTDNPTIAPLYLTSGAIYSNYWGIKASESLGNGLQAIFEATSKISVRDGAGGTYPDAPRIFGRGAFMGLKGDWGQTTFGRRATVISDFFNFGDVFGGPNYNETGFWSNNFYAGTMDNMVRYDLSQPKGFNVSVAYALPSNQGNNYETGSSYQAASYYNFSNGFGLGGAYHLEHKVKKDDTVSWSTAANFIKPNYELHFFYLNSTWASVKGLRKDSVIGVGGKVALTPVLVLWGAGYFDNLKLNQNSGKHSAVMVFLEKAMAKRVGIYVTADYAWASGSGLVTLNTDTNLTNNINRFGFGTGIHYTF